MKMAWREAYTYIPVDSQKSSKQGRDAILADNVDDLHFHEGGSSIIRTPVYVIILILNAAVFAVGGFLLGRIDVTDGRSPVISCRYMSTRSRCRDLLTRNTVDTAQKSFVYNRTFAEAPSNETDRAWEDIFPPHGGFFHNPSIAPEGASLAVYHQLHCVVSTTSH